MRKQDYIALMDRVLDAYTSEKMEELCKRARSEGITEHGFPRLCADIGILIAHGYRTGLLPLFETMMDLCCEGVADPTSAARKTGNEFSVVELCFCLREITAAGLCSPARIEKWRAALASLRVSTSYKYIAAVPPVRINNWAAFAAASEQLRLSLGLADERAFIHNQVASQLLSFDENGMYRDPNEPILYDLMTRLQLLTCLKFGYDGDDRARLDDLLRRGAEQTLRFQSPSGEMPFGGRSNQYLFNEACMAAIFEYEADRLADGGHGAEAAAYKSAADLAVENLRCWLSGSELRHIKNRFPQTDSFGCEKYGYFDKYMITAASNLYKCVLFCRDELSPEPAPLSVIEPKAPEAWHLSPYFHKSFARAGEYFVEYDTAADPNYDASGLGRVHRHGVPSALALTVPFAERPKYSLGDRPCNPSALSLCPVLFAADGTPLHGCAVGCVWTALEECADGDAARLEFSVEIPDGGRVRESCTVRADGVTLRAEIDGDRPLARAFPALASDGKNRTAVTLSPDRRTLTVDYLGHRCTVRTDGEFRPAADTYRNRSGEYALYYAVFRGSVTVTVTLE